MFLVVLFLFCECIMCCVFSFSCFFSVVLQVCWYRCLMWVIVCVGLLVRVVVSCMVVFSVCFVLVSWLIVFMVYRCLLLKCLFDRYSWVSIWCDRNCVRKVVMLLLGVSLILMQVIENCVWCVVISRLQVRVSDSLVLVVLFLMVVIIGLLQWLIWWIRLCKFFSFLCCCEGVMLWCWVSRCRLLLEQKKLLFLVSMMVFICGLVWVLFSVVVSVVYRLVLRVLCVVGL